MKRILTGIAAAAILMTSAASLAEDVQQDTAIQPQQQIQQEQMTPPAMPEGQDQGEQNQMTPPAMPDGQTQGKQSQMTQPAMPDDQNQGEQNQMTPPAMPDDQNQGDQSQMTPPEMPDGQNQGEQSQMTPPAMPDDQNQGNQSQMTPPEIPDGQNQAAPQGRRSRTMTVRTGNSYNLNMRSEPSKKSEVIARYKNGTQVEILEVNDDWVKVSVNGKTGYMMIKFLEENLEDSVEENAQSSVEEDLSGGNS